MAAFVTLALPILAQDNFKISVQGTLKDPNGLAVDDGLQTIIFRLYDQAQGGDLKHQEMADVQVRGGVYSYLLGSGTPLDPAAFNETLFLSLEIAGNELFPRTEMTYAPYSLSVSTAQQAIRLFSSEETCSGSVGDIKYSILTPDQFVMENGDCWIPMDGRSIPNTKLANEYGWANVPDMSGLFIRSAEYTGGGGYDPDRDENDMNYAVASIQLDEFAAHNHGINDPGHKHRQRNVNNTNQPSAASALSGNRYNASGGYDTHTSTTGITIQDSGGSETRPVNRNFYVYIRID